MAEIMARGTNHPPYPSDDQSADTVTPTMTLTPLVIMIKHFPLNNPLPRSHPGARSFLSIGLPVSRHGQHPENKPLISLLQAPVCVLTGL